jgi:hypothetical protein
VLVVLACVKDSEKERNYPSRNGKVVLALACAVSCFTFGSSGAFPDTDSSGLTFPPFLFSSSTRYEQVQCTS